ncbi:MAG: flagellar hook-basal body complex protein FliE [Deltaproteobacteria bacterium]|nr:flagellar hook-basal body complex protein FliE [Deltaproteobacteria bacterium]
MVRGGNLDNIIDHGQAVEKPVAPEIGGGAGLDAGGTAGSKSFGDMLNESIEKVNDLQAQADRAAKELSAGRNKNIHETMLMMEKADMSFRLMMQVRNKVIDAYREIMRMQV